MFKNPRKAADAAVAAWREAEAKAEAARQEQRAKSVVQNGPSMFRRTRNEGDLRNEQIHLARLKAEEAAEQAAHAAARALDQLELAEGQELALQRDPGRLHADLVAMDAEEAQIVAQLESLRTRRKDREHAALLADVKHKEAREAAGLPASPRNPVPQQFTTLLAGHGRAQYLTALADRARNGVPVPNKASQIANSQAEIRKCAADLEEKRLEGERQKEDAEALRANKASEGAAWSRHQQTNAKEQAQAKAAETARRNKLADDYLARQGGAA